MSVVIFALLLLSPAHALKASPQNFSSQSMHLGCMGSKWSAQKQTKGQCCLVHFMFSTQHCAHGSVSMCMHSVFGSHAHCLAMLLSVSLVSTYAW